jgi:hypothetical protein
MPNPQIETSTLRLGGLPAGALAVAAMIGTGMEKGLRDRLFDSKTPRYHRFNPH